MKYWALNNNKSYQNGVGLKEGYTDFESDFNLSIAPICNDQGVCLDYLDYSFYWTSSPYWTSSSSSSEDVVYLTLSSAQAHIGAYTKRANGFSVRCFKN